MVSESKTLSWFSQTNLYLTVQKQIINTPGRDSRDFLQPFLFSEIPQHGNDHDNHHPPHHCVSPSPFELRHELKVHAVHPGNKGYGNKNRGDDGQHLHHLIHAVTDAGKIDLQNGEASNAVSYSKCTNCLTDCKLLRLPKGTGKCMIPSLSLKMAAPKNDASIVELTRPDLLWHRLERMNIVDSNRKGP